MVNNDGVRMRKHVVDLVNAAIRDCIPGKSVSKHDETAFFASHAVQDFAEIFSSECIGGEPDFEDIVMGHGAISAWNLFKNAGTLKQRKAIAKKIIKHIEEHFTDDQLAIMGLIREGDKVKVMLNRRPLGFGDVEHFLCKAHIVRAFTLPARGGTDLKPQMPHCWPSTVPLDIPATFYEIMHSSATTLLVSIWMGTWRETVGELNELFWHERESDYREQLKKNISSCDSNLDCNQQKDQCVGHQLLYPNEPQEAQEQQHQHKRDPVYQLGKSANKRPRKNPSVNDHGNPCHAE
jgi:hypothetical protein